MHSKEDLIKTLKRIDVDIAAAVRAGEIATAAIPIKFILCGGAVLLLRDATSRQVTKDVDVLEVSESINDIMSHYSMFNGCVAAYEDSLPYNYEDRIEPIDVGTNFVRYYAPSNEDLAVMKLYRNSPTDIDDMLSDEFRANLDINLLEHLVYDKNEAAGSRMGDEDRAVPLKEMRHAFEMYKRKVEEKDAENKIVQNISAARKQSALRNGKTDTERKETRPGHARGKR